MKTYFLVLLFYTSSFIFSQYKINGVLENYNNQAVLIKTHVGVEEMLLGKVMTNEKGVFSYKVQMPIKGVVFLDLENNDRIEFFSDNKDIAFTAKIEGQSVENLEFQKSQINQLYQKKQEKEKLENLKNTTLTGLKGVYKPQDEFYKAIEKEISRISMLDSADVSGHPILVEYIDSRNQLSSNPTVDAVAKKIANSSELIESNGMLMQYVAQYLVKSLDGVQSQEEVKGKLSVAIDKIMKDTGIETNRGQHVLTGIIKLLKGNNINDLAEEWLKKGNNLTCKINNELQTTLNGYNNIQVGKQAPNFSFNKQAPFNTLYDVQSDKKLLMFWASWCPHCVEELPFVKQFYEDFKNQRGEIIAVSADISEKDYKEALKKHDIKWINYSDLMRWDSPVLKMYDITGTPTFILLDKNNKILKISSKITEIKAALN